MVKEGRERREGIQEVSATYKGYLGLLKIYNNRNFLKYIHTWKESK